MRKLKNTSLIYTELIVLAFIWLIILAGPVIFTADDQTISWDHLLHSWLKLLPFLVLTLFNHFILVPYLFFRTNKWWYFIGALLTSVVFVLVSNQIAKFPPEGEPQSISVPRPRHNVPPHMRDNMQRPPHPRNENPNRRPSPLPPQTNTFLLAILILGFDTGLRTVFRWIKLEKERDKIEKESVQNELAFLRNQVSPHFFMNMLNNIHSLIDIDTEEAKGSVIRLSHLMRHLLYDSEADNIPLSKEIGFITNYVDLMRLRYSSKVEIKMSLPQDVPDTNIPPLLFTSYLENAFKHGVSYREASFIHIDITIEGKVLCFTIKNSNHKKSSQTEESGIGVENSRKRLDLLYKNKYTLTTEDTPNYYCINLKLPL